MRGKVVILSLLTLGIGTAAGYFIGYYRSKNKYQELADKEIASVRKAYENHFGTQTNTKENTNKHPISNTENKVAVKEDTNGDKVAYSNYAKMYNKESASPVVKTSSTIKTTTKTAKSNPTNKLPYVITPDQFNESEYEAQTLMWFSDKILADTDGNVIHNVEELIGPEALSTFGRYLDDAVYVRNEQAKIDYEILWDARKYSSVYKSVKPKELLADGE